MRERMTTSNASSLSRRTGSIRAIVLSDELGLVNIPAACVLFYTLQVVTWSHRVMELFSLSTNVRAVMASEAA
jgi:hypothetical protein